MSEPTGYLIVGLFALGMGASFFAADPRSPTSRSLSLMFALMGGIFLANVIPRDRFPQAVALRFFCVAEAAAVTTGLEWGLRLSRTGALRADGRHGVEGWLRAAQALALVYGLLGVMFVDLQGEVWRVPWHASVLRRPGFYVFAVPLLLSLLLPLIRFVQLIGGDVDPAERMRLTALLVASPFWLAGISSPPKWKPLSVAIGEIIFLFGAIRYHVLQGQRGEFLARFLSPELARLVRDRGLGHVMQRSRVELSVVACDLRGFTAFEESGAPEEVLKLLEDYYGAVGKAVEDFGGSIKDFAGDGILALVGAPIPRPDHARRAVAMALAIRDRGDRVLERWRKLGLDVGLGVGVASGFATVGAIGSAGRLEYGAVGPAVNLASRLASRAEAGQVLAEPRVVGLAGDGEFRFEKLETAELKGFSRPVTIYAVAGPSKPGAALVQGVA